MECEYNQDMLLANYEMICKSVDECLVKLRDLEISDKDRKLLEMRLRVTFLKTDFSLSALEGFDDYFLDVTRKGVNERRMRWGNYKTSTFRSSRERIDEAYDRAWAELNA